MSVAELHPEHLIEKSVRGTLSDGERAQLDVHVAKCSSCRFELEVRADFSEEMAQDDERISGLVRLVEEATKTKPEPKAPLPIAAPIPVSRRRRASRSVVWLGFAAAMLVVVGAAASEAGRSIWVPIFIHDSVPVAPTPTDHVEVQRNPVAPIHLPPPVEVTSAAPVDSAVAPVVAPIGSAPAPSASTLLDAESDARRRGDYDRVLAIHADLVAKHPSSHEAQTSRITVARMLLDRGDANGALAGFDAYLANGSGELGEDALAGRATSLERVGRNEDARTAWSALVEKYPTSTYATHARARMEALADR